MVVASQVDGRIRIRDEALRKEPLATRVREALAAEDGITEVENNQRIGSLLVLYNAARTAAEKILRRVSELLGTSLANEEESDPVSGASRPGQILKRLAKSVSPRIKNNLVNVGMLASLMVSLALAFTGLKKLHILTGILFVALFGDHFYQRKERIFV